MILFITGSGKNIGNGHLVRTSEVYKIIKKKYPTLITTRNNLNDLKLNFSKVKVVFLDQHSGLDELIYFFKEKNILTIALDWFGEELVDINIVIFPHTKPKAHKKVYLGFKYVIIRDEILKLKNINSFKYDYLISLGSSDLKNYGNEILNNISFNNKKAAMIIGEYNENIYNNSLDIFKCPKDFPEILNKSKVIFTNGGGTLFESIFLKKDTIAFPQTVFEENIVNQLFLEGLVSKIGFTKTNNELDKSKFHHIIDGKGVDRIVKIIEENYEL